MKFSIEQEVIEKDCIRAHTSYPVMKVVGYTNTHYLCEHYGNGFDGEIHPESYTGEPGSRSWRSAFDRYQESELFTLDEAHVELRRLEAVEDKLTEEFEAIRGKIQEKMDAAATLVQEAAEMSKPYNRKFRELKQECRGLYTAIMDGGWSDSTMQC